MYPAAGIAVRRNEQVHICDNIEYTARYCTKIQCFMLLKKYCLSFCMELRLAKVGIKLLISTRRVRVLTICFCATLRQAEYAHSAASFDS